MANKYWVGGTGTWAATLSTLTTSAISAIGSHVLTFTAVPSSVTVGQCVTGTNIPGSCTVASKTATTVTLTGTAFTIAVASATVVTFSNWATLTGGIISAAVPATTDLAVFDINSNGTGGGVNAYTVTRTATTAVTGITMNGNITFAGSAILGITGSLLLGTNTLLTLPTWTMTGIVTISGTVATTLSSNLTTFASPLNCSMTAGIAINGTGIVSQSTYTHTTGQNLCTSITCTTFICNGGTLAAGTMNCTTYTHTAGTNNSTTTNCTGALNHVAGAISTTLTCNTYAATGTLAATINDTSGTGVIITGNASTVCNITNALFSSPTYITVFKYTYAGSVGTRLITSTSTNGAYVYHIVSAGSDTINITNASILGGLDFTGFTGTFAGTSAFTISGLYVGAVGYIISGGGDLIQTAGTWTNTGTVTLTSSSVCMCYVDLSVTIASPIVVTGATTSVYGPKFTTSSTYTHTSGTNQCYAISVGALNQVAGIISATTLTCNTYTHTAGINQSSYTTYTGAVNHIAGTISAITLTCNTYTATGTLTATLDSYHITITGNASTVCNITNNLLTTTTGVNFYYTYTGSAGTRIITTTATAGIYLNHFVTSGSDIINITNASFLCGLTFQAGFGGIFAGNSSFAITNGGVLIAQGPVTWTNTGTVNLNSSSVINLPVLISSHIIANNAIITGTGFATSGNFTNIAGTTSCDTINCATYTHTSGITNGGTIGCQSYTHTAGTNQFYNTFCSGAVNHVSGIIDTTLSCDSYAATGTLATNINTTRTNIVNITGGGGYPTTVCNITNNLFASSSTSGVVFNYSANAVIGTTRLITVTSTNGTYVYHAISAGSDTINVTNASILGGLNFTGFTGTFAGTSAFTINSLYSGVGVSTADLIQTGGTWTNTGAVTLTGTNCLISLLMPISSPIIVSGATTVVTGTGFTTSGNCTNTSGALNCTAITCATFTNTSGNNTNAITCTTYNHTAGTINGSLDCTTYTHTAGINQSSYTHCAGAVNHIAGTIISPWSFGTYSCTGTLAAILGESGYITGGGAVNTTVFNITNTLFSTGGSLPSVQYTAASSAFIRTITVQTPSCIWLSHFIQAGTDTITIGGTVAYFGMLNFSGFGGTFSGAVPMTFDGTITNTGVITASTPFTWTNTGIITYAGTSSLVQGDLLSIIPNSVVVNLTSSAAGMPVISLNNVISTGTLTLTQGSITVGYYNAGFSTSFSSFIITSNALYRNFGASNNNDFPGLSLTSTTPFSLPATTTNLSIDGNSCLNLTAGGSTGVSINTGAISPLSTFTGSIAATDLLIDYDITTHPFALPAKSLIFNSANTAVGTVTTGGNDLTDYPITSGTPIQGSSPLYASYNITASSATGSSLSITNTAFTLTPNNIIINTGHLMSGTITVGGIGSTFALTSGVVRTSQVFNEAFTFMATSTTTLLTSTTPITLKNSQQIFNPVTGVLVGTLGASAGGTGTTFVWVGTAVATSTNMCAIVQSFTAAISVITSIVITGLGATLFTGQQILTASGGVVGTIMTGGSGSTFALTGGVATTSQTLHPVITKFYGTIICTLTSTTSITLESGEIWDANNNILGTVPGYVTSTTFTLTGGVVAASQTMKYNKKSSTTLSSGIDLFIKPSQYFYGTLSTTLSLLHSRTLVTGDAIMNGQSFVGIITTGGTDTGFPLTNGRSTPGSNGFNVATALFGEFGGYVTGGTLLSFFTYPTTTLLVGTTIYDINSTLLATISSVNNLSQYVTVLTPDISMPVGGVDLIAVPPTITNFTASTGTILSTSTNITVPAGAQVYANDGTPLGNIISAAGPTNSFIISPSYLKSDGSFGYVNYPQVNYPATSSNIGIQKIPSTNIMSTSLASSYVLTPANGSIMGALKFLNFSGSMSTANSITVCGTLSLCSTMTWSSSATLTLSSSPSSQPYLYGNNCVLDCPVTFNAPFKLADITYPYSGTWTFGGDFTIGATRTVSLLSGALNDGGWNLKLGTFTNTGSLYSMLAFCNGTWTVNATGSCWTVSGTNIKSGGYQNSTIILNDNTTAARTFAGGGLTYGTLRISGNTSTSNTTITGNNTFSGISSDKTVAHTLMFAGGSTTTLSTWGIKGSLGNVVTITSPTASVHNLVNISGTDFGSDYINVSYSNATSTIANTNWYAGPLVHSTKGTSVTGWMFAYPSFGNFLAVF